MALVMGYRSSGHGSLCSSLDTSTNYVFVTLHTKVPVPIAVVGMVEAGMEAIMVVGHPISEMMPFVRRFDSTYTGFRSVAVTNAMTVADDDGPSIDEQLGVMQFIPPGTLYGTVSLQHYYMQGRGMPGGPEGVFDDEGAVPRAWLHGSLVRLYSGLQQVSTGRQVSTVGAFPAHGYFSLSTLEQLVGSAS